MSSKIYHSYFNGAYELFKKDAVAVQRSIHGPAPLAEIVKLIAGINPQAHDWQRQMGQQLERAHFRTVNILCAAQNEMHASKVYYLASKCFAHTKLLISSLAAIVLAPGYLVKNQPDLALYLGFPTLKKISEKMQSYFFQTGDNLLLEGVSYSFLDLIKEHLSRSVLPLFSHLSQAKDQPFVSGTAIINDPQAAFNFGLFDLLRTGLMGTIVARQVSSKEVLAEILEKREISISNWRFFGVGRYFDKFLSFGVLTHSGKKLDEAFLRALIHHVRFAAPFLEGELLEVQKELLAKKTRTTSDLFNAILSLLEKRVFYPAEHISRMYQLDVPHHFEKLKVLIAEHVQAGSSTNECAKAVSQYFCDLTTAETMQSISSEVSRRSNPPFFIKYLSIFPYGKKVESLYREFSSIAQFSRIEWPLIGGEIQTGVWDWGKNLLISRNWRRVLITSGLTLATAAVAYAAFRYVIKPHFERWEHQTLIRLTARPQDETILAFPKGFLEYIPGITDYKIWHAIKGQVKRAHSTLPLSWQADPVLVQRRCPIFDTPIRIPVQLKVNDQPLKDGSGTILLFEEGHLQAWLNQQTSMSPITEHLPEWIPENFQFQNSMVEIDPVASDQIELRCLLLKSMEGPEKTLYQKFKDRVMKSLRTGRKNFNDLIQV